MLKTVALPLHCDERSAEGVADGVTDLDDADGVVAFVDALGDADGVADGVVLYAVADDAKAAGVSY